MTTVRVETHGVRTMIAPRARSMTSFSRLIFAGSVMMHLANELRLDTTLEGASESGERRADIRMTHLYPLIAQHSASPIPVFPPIASQRSDPSPRHKAHTHWWAQLPRSSPGRVSPSSRLPRPCAGTSVATPDLRVRIRPPWLSDP